MMRALALILTFGAAVVSAQPAEAPVLTPHEHDRLKLAAAQVENAALRVQLAQVALQQAQERLGREMAALERDGYRLTRDSSGEWSYVSTKEQR